MATSIRQVGKYPKVAVCVHTALGHVGSPADAPRVGDSACVQRESSNRDRLFLSLVQSSTFSSGPPQLDLLLHYGLAESHPLSEHRAFGTIFEIWKRTLTFV